MQSKVKSQKLKVKSFLEEIVKKKKAEFSQKTRNTRKTRHSKNQEIRRSDPGKFLNAFTNNNNSIGLIAEVKFASPTNPNLGSQKELLKRVGKYEESGADAISLITEKHFFKGDIEFISEVKKVVSLPVLQKDFVIDVAQIYEAKEIGSDALLLIARLVSPKKLKQFVDICFVLGIEPVVEINDEEDLKNAITTDTNIIAVNARDLETFVIDVEKACQLMKKIPDKFTKLAFSGIHSAKEVQLYKNAGAKGVLVGTSLMQTNNITKFINSLRVLPETKSKVKVKICGIQSHEDAQKAIAAGADYLGFIFVKSSERFVEPMKAKKIIEKVRNKVAIVGVFRNNTLEEVNALCEELNFDLVQLHGEESPEFCQNVKCSIIKVFGLTKNFDTEKVLRKMKQYDVRYYLIDRENPGVGDALSLGNASVITKRFPTFFAGGLTPESVADVVRYVKPFAADVISGVKTDDKFDLKRMKKFVSNAKGVTL